jgi:hypothetical protein
LITPIELGIRYVEALIGSFSLREKPVLSLPKGSGWGEERKVFLFYTDADNEADDSK